MINVSLHVEEAVVLVQKRNRKAVMPEYIL